MKLFSYALRELAGSEFNVVSKSVDGLVSEIRQDPLLLRKEMHHVRG